MRIRNAILIRTGVSKNRNRYSEALLRAGAPLFEGLGAYAGHQTDAGGRLTDMARKSDPRNLIGRWSNVRYENGAIRGDLEVYPTGKTVLETAQAASDLVGVSIDIAAKSKVVRESGQMIRDIEAFTKSPFNSVDIVVNPSAGGRLFESATDDWWTHLENTAMDKVVESIMAKPELKALVEATVEESAREGLTADKLKESYPAVWTICEATLARVTETVKPEPVKPEKKPDTSALDTELAKARELRESLEIQASDGALDRRLTESKLPDEIVGIIRPSFAGHTYDKAELETRITEAKAALARLSGSGRIRENGGQVDVGVENIERKSKALQGFFANADVDKIPRYKSFREAYHDFTGTQGILANPYDILRETYGKQSYDSARETMTMATWADIFANAMWKAVIREFSNPVSDQGWRAITSNVETITTFDTQSRIRYGGFGVIPTVTENGTYQPLADPSDETETYALGKKGGLYSITLEAIASDRSGAIRSIPQRMGRAARITLNRDVFSLLTTNATMGDAVALYHTDSTARGGDGSTAASGNLGTTAFSTAALGARRLNMLKRATYGETISSTKMDAGTIVPRLIVVPVDLEQSAWEATKQPNKATGASATALTTDISTIGNFMGTVGWDVITVPHWTDATDWYLIADPASCPTIEVGFFNGRQEPDILSKEEFEVDAITYKLRFIYGGQILEPLCFDQNHL